MNLERRQRLIYKFFFSKDKKITFGQYSAVLLKKLFIIFTRKKKLYYEM